MKINEEKIILKVDRIVKEFKIHQSFSSYTVKALKNITFKVNKGEILGICGESGCGKSVLLRSISYLDPPTSGSVVFEGKDLSRLKGKKRKDIRLKMQIVFQDPYTSLHPKFTAEKNVLEPLIINRIGANEDRKIKVQHLFDRVKIPLKYRHFLPHQFSGGQRQRIALARALAVNPKILLLDSPTSLLDVSIKSQILNLIRNLQNELKLTYILTENDLGILKQVADRIAVMHRGEFIEMGSRESIFSNPQHPYTTCLLNAVPTIKKGLSKIKLIDGSNKIGENAISKSCCSFYEECNKRSDICSTQPPNVNTIERDHLVLCHNVH
jgi:peptide/nickel transport system ATP-binding protein